MIYKNPRNDETCPKTATYSFVMSSSINLQWIFRTLEIPGITAEPPESIFASKKEFWIIQVLFMHNRSQIVAVTVYHF